MVSEYDKNEKHAQACGGDGEEVEGDDVPHVVVKERPPGLRWRFSIPASDVLPDGRLGDIDPKFHQFGVNARRSPERIGLRHRPNQETDIGRDRWSPDAPSTFPGPERPEALAMPGDNGLWRHDDECGSPIAPRA